MKLHVIGVIFHNTPDRPHLFYAGPHLAGTRTRTAHALRARDTCFVHAIRARDTSIAHAHAQCTRNTRTRYEHAHAQATVT